MGPRKDQTGIPVTFVRGGSSKALFFHEKDLPPQGPLRDRVLKRAMGSPDPLQIDGMGGTKAVTSKIAILRPSTRPNTDVDYTFVQVGVAEDTIGYEANCGNISAGVGPFAIEEGLVQTFRESFVFGESKMRTQEVRIYHTGTKKDLISHVPIDEEGYPIASGDFEIAAVPDSGAPILLDYRETVGASQNRGLLPSKNAVDRVEIGGKTIEITICDAANICIFARAADFGVTGFETAANLTENKVLIQSLRELRGKGAQLVGMCEHWNCVDVESPFMPMPVLVAPPSTAEDHISGRLFLDNMCHESMAGTGSVCFAACSRIKGSVVNKMMSSEAQAQDTFKIAHPRGMIPVLVTVEESTKDTIAPKFNTLSFTRTSRRLMDGLVYVPKMVYDLTQRAVTNDTTKVKSHTNGGGQEQTNGTSHADSVGNNTDDDRNGLKGHEAQQSDIPVTQILAEFVASARSELLAPTLREKLREVIIDYIGVTIGGAVNAPSTERIWNAVQDFVTKTSQGTSTVLTKGKIASPPYAALLNATFGHSLDFDDTFAEGSLHAGVTAISAALTVAEQLGSSITTDTLLLAIAVGYEITCRLGREQGFDAYRRGFHNTSTCGIFGTISTIAVLRGLSAKTIEMAFGLAGSKAAGSMQYLDNGSWNKRLHAGFAVHDAFICVGMAEAGVLGATRAIEGRFGFLQGYSPSKKDLKRLTSDLGKKWLWLATALKPFPACRMTHCFIEMAGQMGEASGNNKSVKQIKLYLTPPNFEIIGQRSANKVHPRNIVDAQFSAYYQTANAWKYGPDTGLKTYDRLGTLEIDDFCDKIECIASTSLKGEFASYIEVAYEDGSHEERHMIYPLGETEHPFTKEQVDQKFFGLVEPVYGRPKARKILQTVDEFEKHSLSDLLELLQ